VSLPRDAAVILPARRASSRLPDKLLLAESGQPLLAHTIQQCLRAEQARVIAAVDCLELAEVAEAAGAEVVMTDPDLASGSDRVWAAVQAQADLRWIINVQGDEPEIDPEVIGMLLDRLRSGAQVATLCAPLADEHFADPACVKVVRGTGGQALYFSRSAIPYPRNPAVSSAQPRLHVGVYAYTREALARFAVAAPTPLEQCEGLEQLRFLEHGVSIEVLDCAHSFPGIDTRSDYDAFLRRLSPPHAPSSSAPR